MFTPDNQKKIRVPSVPGEPFLTILVSDSGLVLNVSNPCALYTGRSPQDRKREGFRSRQALIAYADETQEPNSGQIFADVGEKCGENLAKKFADFRPSISRRKKFHEKSSTDSTSHEIKFFHRETLGAWGHNHVPPTPDPRQGRSGSESPPFSFGTLNL